jgi:hypothetical protein
LTGLIRLVFFTCFNFCQLCLLFAYFLCVALSLSYFFDHQVGRALLEHNVRERAL